MNSIEVGKAIYQILVADSRIQNLIQNKIYPLIAENSTTYPFIVYQRSNLTPIYTKDIRVEDEVIIDVACISDKYAESIELAGIVVEILDNKRFNQYGITQVRINSAYEDFTDDAFFQTLGFTITLNK